MKQVTACLVSLFVVLVNTTPQDQQNGIVVTDVDIAIPLPNQPEHHKHHEHKQSGDINNCREFNLLD